jgi:hypothetical protein
MNRSADWQHVTSSASGFPVPLTVSSFRAITPTEDRSRKSFETVLRLYQIGRCHPHLQTQKLIVEFRTGFKTCWMCHGQAANKGQNGKRCPLARSLWCANPGLRPPNMDLARPTTARSTASWHGPCPANADRIRVAARRIQTRESRPLNQAPVSVPAHPVPICLQRILVRRVTRSSSVEMTASPSSGWQESVN